MSTLAPSLSPDQSRQSDVLPFGATSTAARGLWDVSEELLATARA